MKKIVISFAAFVLLTCFLAGCNLLPAAEVKTDSLDYRVDRVDSKFNQNPVVVNANLPVQKLMIVSGGNRHEFEVEIASTDAQREVGLMNRKSLDENKGMLFAFETKGYLYFWMKNTLFSLDLIFMDENGYIKHIARGAQPCVGKPDNQCAKYGSEEPAKYVLEINGGLSDKLGIKEGDKAAWL
jgi:uncharacterized membrane protein (UPF0127 family)